MDSLNTLIILLLLVTVCIASSSYLFRALRQERQLASLVGLLCFAMGFSLLIIDLILISFLHGPQHIPDYLLFNRLVSDSGFAGRWMLTVYLFIATGFGISIYQLARETIKKFNMKNKS
jgi:type IV secretory pathway TrbD component